MSQPAILSNLPNTTVQHISFPHDADRPQSSGKTYIPYKGWRKLKSYIGSESARSGKKPVVIEDTFHEGLHPHPRSGRRREYLIRPRNRGSSSH